MNTHIIYRFLIVSFLVLCANIISAQKTAMIMEALVTDDGKKMSGAVVEVYRDGKFVEKVLTDGKGRADIPMAVGGVYTITISGKNKITKKIEVNTKNVPADLSDPIYYPAEVNIFNKLDGLDYSILDKPIGKVSYSEEYGDFSADESHTKAVQASLKKLTKDYLAQKEKELLKEKENQRLYDIAIKIADKAFAEERWEEAEVEYKKAEQLMPIETYPSFQLAELKSKLIEVKKLNAKYDQAIAAAESAEKEKDYATAISEFKRASGYKPNESYPSGKVKELQATLANAAKVEQDYLAAIEKGDNALKINELNAAKAAFEEAAKFKPDETYPKNRLAEINDILGKQKQKEEEYNTALKAGDDALAAKEYEKAKSSYEKASAVKPTEKYPKDQITKVNTLLAEAAKKEQDYLAAVEQGDNALAANKFEEAKSAFTNASQIKPSEEYPKNKIKEIDDFIAKNAAKDKAYQDNIAEADKALSSKSYDLAKEKYLAASNIKPTETYPKEKITEIEGILAANAEKEQKYNEAIAAADKALAAEDYDAAKSAYTNALAIKADEKYPQDKLAEIEGIIVGMKEQDEKYNTAIKNGDDALANSKLEDAKKAYLEASSIKPTESYPQDKLAEIDKIIAANAEKESNYTAAIEEGDAAFETQDYDKASAAYSKALSIKPEETYPQNQLSLIDEKKAELEAEKAAAEKLEADYAAAIKNGDDALANSDYSKAKSAYESASALKSDEQYPKDKIKEVEGLIAANAEKEENYKKAIEAGDKLMASEDYASAKTEFENAASIKPEESYPKDQLAAIETKLKEIADAEAAAAKLDADYQAAIADGDAKFEAKEYEAAISAFNKATELKPNESYPSEKLAEIKGIQDQLAAEAAEKEKQEALQKQYDELIAKADKSFGAGELESARTDYQSALSLKSDESYPQTKIDEINGMLADAAEQDKLYQDAITEADKFLAAEDLESAKSKYVEASSVKPGEQYPKDKIAEIETKLAEIAAEQEEIRIANEKAAEIESNYKALIEEADALFNSGDYDNAIAKYSKAIEVKDEQYPRDQLRAIDAKLDQMAKDADQAKIDAEYQAIISEADAMFASEDFENAKAKYQEALNVKQEQYAQDQIAAIDAKVAELASLAEKEAADAAAAEVETNYQAAISKADDAFNANDFDAAEQAYTEALSIKPEETYPQSQLGIIDAKRDEAAKLAADAEAAAAKAKAEAELEEKYQAAISKADNAFNANDFDAAEQAYTEALSIKPEETYPQSQLGIIDAKRDEAAKLAADAEAAAAKAELEEKYQAAISKADNAFNADDFDTAEQAYTEALSIKPEETYPESQLGIIDAKRDEAAKLAAEAEAAAAKAKAAAELEANYSAAVAEGDEAFAANDFDKAENAYTKALSLKPEEVHPQTQLGLIDAKREEIAIQQQQAEAEKAEQARLAKIEQDYLAAIESADNLLSSKELVEAKKSYELASSIKPTEEYPKNKIAEIDGLIEAEKAAAEADRAKLNQQYQEAIGSADNAFSSRAWDNAIAKYEEASKYKPDEPYPLQKIEEIRQIIADKKAKEEEARLARERAAANEASYQTAIVEGDNAFKAEDYINAKSRYRLASDLKPDEEYPQEKLKEIQAILDAAAAEKAAAEKARSEAIAKEREYATLISSADDSFERGSFSSAKRDYSAAIRLKPNETYPKSQLALVNAELEKQRQARLEELRKADEPIQIQKGPRSTITTDAEDEIDRIYKEMWEKRNSDKNEKLEKTLVKYTDLNKSIKEKETERRKNAMEQIEEIAISMQASSEGTDDVYMQNYETVLEKEKNIKVSTEELNREAERRRQDQYNQETYLADNIRTFNQEKSEELIEGKKESVEKQTEDQLETIKEYHAGQDGRITEAKELNEDRAEKRREYFSELAVNNAEKNQDYVADENSKWSKAQEQYVASGNKKTEEEKEKVFQKREDVRNYEKHLAENQGIDAYQQKINDQQVEIRQFSEERNDNYKENQEKIDKKVEVIQTETERLETEAEKKRQSNSEAEYYQGEDRPREDRLAEQYPQGVSEEIIENQNNSTTIRRIVVEGTQVDIFEKTLYSWGGIFYTKNGENTTQQDWDTNSK